MEKRVAKDGLPVSKILKTGKGLTNKRDKSIGFYSLLIVTVYLELFWTLREYIVNWLTNLPGINDKLSTVFVGIIGIISASGIYYLIYKIVYNVYLTIWARKNARAWVNGDWIHVHIKDVIRIGFLHIDQEFERIYVHGYNINPDNQMKETNITTWKYEVGRIIKEACHTTDEDEYYGSYCAERKSGLLGGAGTVKYGIHRMKITATNNKNGLPERMEGYFGDTAKDIGDGGTIKQHYGDLYFIRIGKRMQNYMKKCQSQEARLSFIRDEFNNEGTDYKEIRDLQDIAKRYNIKESHPNELTD